jgi:hypothetical protein
MFTREDLQQLFNRIPAFRQLIHPLLDVTPKDSNLRQALGSATSIEEMDHSAILTSIAGLQERIWQLIESANLKTSRGLFQSVRDAADKSDAGSLNRGLDALRSLLNLNSPPDYNHPLSSLVDPGLMRNRDRLKPQSFVQAVSLVYDLALGGDLDREIVSEAARIDEACRNFVENRHARVLALLREKHAELVLECRQVKDSLGPLDGRVYKLNQELARAQGISDAYKEALRSSRARQPLPQHYPTAEELAAWQEEVKNAERAFVFELRKVNNIQQDRDIARAELEGAKAEMARMADKEIEWRVVIKKLSPSDTSSAEANTPASFFV